MAKAEYCNRCNKKEKFYKRIFNKMLDTFQKFGII